MLFLRVERGFCFVKPARGAHLFEQCMGAMQQAAPGFRIPLDLKLPIGQQALGKLRLGLDIAEDVDAATEIGIRFIRITGGSVNPAKGAKRRAEFKGKASLFSAQSGLDGNRPRVVVLVLDQQDLT